MLKLWLYEPRDGSKYTYSAEMIFDALHKPEWLLLNSSIFNRGKVSDILKEPYLYIESSKHISWERYFTVLLQEVTRGTELEYTKKHLNKRYFIGNNLKSIKECVPEETGIEGDHTIFFNVCFDKAKKVIYNKIVV